VDHHTPARMRLASRQGRADRTSVHVEELGAKVPGSSGLANARSSLDLLTFLSLAQNARA